MLRLFLGIACCAAVYPILFFYTWGRVDLFPLSVIGAICIFIALPWFLHICSEKVPSFREVVSVGGTIGLLCSVPFVFATGPFVIVFSVPFALFGMSCGLIFWLVGVYRNSRLPTGWRIPFKRKAD